MSSHGPNPPAPAPPTPDIPACGVPVHDALAPGVVAHHSAAPLPLQSLVDDIDLTPDPVAGAALLRVTERPLQVARLLLDGDHPLDVLLGFTAPASWLAIGLRCQGHAYDLTRGSRAAPDAAAGPGAADDPVEPVPVVVTVLIDRSGHGAGALRRGASVTRLDGPPEGVVGDACRRALGLATAPPPPSTADLWLRVWLDRVVEAAAFADDAERFGSWDAVAALHPAAPSHPTAIRANPRSTREPGLAADPYMLADATLQLAAAWPWARLRRDPEIVDTAQPPLPRHLTDWMDDGMFARWVLADTVGLPLLSRSVGALLPAPLTAAIAETVTTSGLSWPEPTEVDR